MKRVFSPRVISFIAIFVVFSGLFPIHSEAALATHSGNANNADEPQGDELPRTYGEAIVERMYTSGRWAYSVHSAFIGNYAGGEFGPQTIDFDVTYVCEIEGTNRTVRVFDLSVKELEPYYDAGAAAATWSDRNRRNRVKRDGLPGNDYTFTAYTALDARDVDRPRDQATWHAEHSITIQSF